MSQRDHVARTASSQGPGSPPAPIEVISPLSRHGGVVERFHGATEEQFNRPQGAPPSSDAERHALARQSSVFNILNPAGAAMASDVGSSTRDTQGVPQSHDEHDGTRARLSLSPPQPAGFSEGALHHHQYHHHHRQPAHPASGRSASIGTVPNRSPPGLPQPPLSAETSRRLLTPRSPRSLSTSHASLMGPRGPALGQLPTPAASRHIQSETAVPGQFEQTQRFTSHPNAPHGPSSGRPSPAHSFATPARAHSQPMIPPMHAHQLESDRRMTGSGQLGQTSAATPPPFVGTAFAPYSPGLEQGWAVNLSGPGPSRASRMGGTAPGDSQLSFAINPVGGERMVIPVETYSGSKQADEKRQRNAGASARFRKRKKTKEEANVINIQRLEKDVRDLERRVQETQGESDRLRADRDRLRDVVLRTSEISYLAFQGPQSPTSSRAAMQLPGRSPLDVMASPSLPVGAPYGAADPLTGERATRRRRTDSHVDTGGPPYSMGQPVLPALTSPGYQISHPGTPHSITRPPSLPPLSGLTTPPPPGPSSFEPGPPTSAAYQPTTYRRETYETGWAVGPSDSRAPPDARRQ
ncbi:hypothetical protein Micbo1qcDRAFT_44705 [Microdochium bolleyi]|uniref:BZIP domain-containing protein n=1 Tax=Microdochium bolleyi TaxID=196109 RepID=A0A136JBL5_9PEZI|nr:hypothetical protein Micbo1qcDRAFT_44705 [Microdochium bolleyi]